jgi:hypothetical protein
MAKLELMEAGLALAANSGLPLKSISTDGRIRSYETEDGRTVRGRTCTLPQLPIVRVGDEVTAPGVPERLLRVFRENDFTLAITPEKARTPGAVMAFLIPNEVIIEHLYASAKAGSKDWSLSLRDKTWAAYRLAGSASATFGSRPLPDPKGEDGVRATPSSPRSLGEVIEEARRNIAAAAHVPESSVKIQIDLS